MPDILTITKTEGRVIVLHLAGKLDGETQGTLWEAARAAQAAGKRFLVIDLRNLEMITSAGLGSLHNIYKLFTPIKEIEAWDQAKHGEPYKSAYFKLAAAPSNIAYILNIAGFHHTIPI
jgi:ABC-type transporter Mla MlaB component